MVLAWLCRVVERRHDYVIYGIPEKAPPKKTDEARQKLAALYAEQHSLEQMAWTPDLEEALMLLRERGISYREIAGMMDKTKPAIAARVRYLRLGRRLSATATPQVGSGDEAGTHTAKSIKSPASETHPVKPLTIGGPNAPDGEVR